MSTATKKTKFIFIIEGTHCKQKTGYNTFKYKAKQKIKDIPQTTTEATIILLKTKKVDFLGKRISLKKLMNQSSKFSISVYKR